MIENTNKTFDRAHKFHLTYTYEVNICRHEDEKPFVAVTIEHKMASKKQIE